MPADSSAPPTVDRLKATGEELQPLTRDRDADLENTAADASSLKVPQQWQLCLKPGAGQCEHQGYETWTREEKQLWKEGKLREKWGIGQVSIRLPIQDCSVRVAILYGYLPFIIPIWWAIWALTTYCTRGAPRFFPTFGLAIAAGFAIVNELVTKQICKRVLSTEITDRPPEAVCKHPGMPSGHVMNAYTLMVWCLLETLMDDSDMIHIDWLLLILLVMAPVPWARVYNRDHTVCQVTASACCSVVMGSVAYHIRSKYFPHHEQLWDWYSIESMEVESPMS